MSRLPLVLMAILLAPACSGPEEPTSPGAGPPEEASPAAETAEEPPDDIFTDTKNPDEVFGRGVALFQKGKFNEAARAFLQAARMRPGNPNAHYLAARSLRKSSPPDLLGTEEQLRKVLELQADHLDAHIGLAQAYDQWGRYEEAAIILEQARELDPDLYGVLYLSGRVATRLGRDEEAVGYLQKAAPKDPSGVDAYLELGLALSHLNREEEALEAYKEVIRRDPMNAQALQGAGFSLQRLGRDREADRMLVRFREAQDRDEEERKGGKAIGVRLLEVREDYEAGRREEARHKALLAKEEFPGNPSAFRQLGGLQASMGDLEAAITTYEEALVFQPRSLDVNYRLMKLYSIVGDQQRAVDQRRRYEQLALEARERRKQ